MNLKNYTRLWVLILIALAWESYALNNNTFVSFFALLKENLPQFKNLNLAPDPGKTISLWYGWTGFGLMLLTNLYVIKKRWSPLRKLGKFPGWLDFHIFCGLVGPTFILFHTNFKIGGLVAMSFWCMVVSFSSGIIGRYFFTQIVSQTAELEKELLLHENSLKTFEHLKEQTLVIAGVSTAEHTGSEAGISAAVLNSLMGDVRLMFWMPKQARGLPVPIRDHLRLYAKTKRRMAYLGQFQSVMGYWHSFHLPFAVFMYIIAVIHIVTALLFRVAD
ncbi:MAG TPA: hypothetical protein DCS07_18275 [Bdellovibrionales bacterium]|nr:MAG: hypothetical protein A2Z97_16395 [Bdellovibrionales bacterium GWB1_52_6]OFZ03838.1 MAG: hypothetical protein A2X97_15680 [Bdellovibrionales bacterium GWA1_52_35]OFZ38677.1 MAG: hypothetical protein A2070_10825 [Bdellovibrionales bacterium GWC1_52_8]HAR44550.1 hypothetical protein [Bdellovibrionales bacterium]HCM39727.1 hypothetical protein [Bdellovibrionales bacterium]